MLCFSSDAVSAEVRGMCVAVPLCHTLAWVGYVSNPQAATRMHAGPKSAGGQLGQLDEPKTVATRGGMGGSATVSFWKHASKWNRPQRNSQQQCTPKGAPLFCTA